MQWENAHEKPLMRIHSLHILRGKDTSSHKGNASFLPALFTKQCQRSDFSSNVNLETWEIQKRCTQSLGNGQDTVTYRKEKKLIKSMTRVV